MKQRQVRKELLNMENKNSNQDETANSIKHNASEMCFLRWSKKKPKADFVRSKRKKEIIF